MAYLKTTYEAPRWMGLSDKVRNKAFMLGLELEIDVRKRFITESVRLKVTGSDESVRAFMRWIKSWD